jgi:hypothetical protein
MLTCKSVCIHNNINTTAVLLLSMRSLAPKHDTASLFAKATPVYMKSVVN